MILRCTCKHEFQDKTYGAGMRLHNPMKKDPKSSTAKYRCTVCGSVKEK